MFGVSLLCGYRVSYRRPASNGLTDTENRETDSLDGVAVGLPEFDLANLARGGLREVIDELDDGRALEVCEVVAGEFDDLVLGEGSAVGGHDDRLGCLAPL